MSHLLVTNDFPPKLGGIQSYLYELWRRLDPERFVVLTHGDAAASSFDAAQRFRIERTPSSAMLLPTRSLRVRIDRLAAETGAELVVLDPALPLGALGPSLATPYAVVLHGAEVTVPARLWPSRPLMRRVIEHADLLIAAGGYPAREARALSGRSPAVAIVPPGVDVERFRPLDPGERRGAREQFGIATDRPVVVCVSRLVPRKGTDVLIEASSRLAAEFPHEIVIGGAGRDLARLVRLADRRRAPVRFVGRIPDVDLPALLGCADIFAMCCRDRWLGLEQEGFGIVFLEAAASGVAQIAGRSGGAAEAVEDEVTGLVLDRPGDVAVCVESLARLLGDASLREHLGRAARARAVASFDYARLVGELDSALAAHRG